MATGVFRGSSADRLEREAAARRASSLLIGRPVVGPPAPVSTVGRLTTPLVGTSVGGGRGTAVNTVGQSAAVGRPGATVGGSAPRPGVAYGGMPAGAAPTTNRLMSPGYGRGGIVETGTGGYQIGGFPTGIIGEAARSVYGQPRTPDLSNVNWEGLGQIMRDAGIPVAGGTGGGTAGGSSGGGTGGGGGTMAPPATQPNPLDELLKQFEEVRAAEEARIKGAGADLVAALQGRDPMAQFQWNPASINIPQATMADYVQAIGGSPGEVQATQQMGQQLLNAFLGDVGQVAQGATAAEANWRARQQDVANQLTADAQRQLALNAMAAQMGIKQAKTAEEQARINQALQLALEYGRTRANGSNLGVTAPTLPFETVTLPGYGTITLPSTLG